MREKFIAGSGIESCSGLFEAAASSCAEGASVFSGFSIFSFLSECTIVSGTTTFFGKIEIAEGIVVPKKH